MGTLEKVTLSNRELSDLRKIQDNYNAEAKTLQENLGKRFEQFWQEVRVEHDLGDNPFHVMDGHLWVLRDGTQEDQDAFVKMTRYK